MAVNDAVWINGESKLIKSSGETPTPYWVGGESFIIHEYIISASTTVTSITVSDSGQWIDSLNLNNNLIIQEVLSGNDILIGINNQLGVADDLIGEETLNIISAFEILGNGLFVESLNNSVETNISDSLQLLESFSEISVNLYVNETSSGIENQNYNASLIVNDETESLDSVDFDTPNKSVADYGSFLDALSIYKSGIWKETLTINSEMINTIEIKCDMIKEFEIITRFANG